GVVAVVVGVQQGAHRPVGDAGDPRQVVPGPLLGGAGVHAHHAPAADQEAGVVQPPRPVRLQVGVDAVTDLLQHRSTSAHVPLLVPVDPPPPEPTAAGRSRRCAVPTLPVPFDPPGLAPPTRPRPDPFDLAVPVTAG